MMAPKQCAWAIALLLFLPGGFQARGDSCMDASGSFDCSALPDRLQKLQTGSGPGATRECHVTISKEVADQANRCLPIKTENACKSHSGDCTWSYQENKCQGFFLEDCRVRSLSSQIHCTSLEWHRGPLKKQPDSKTTLYDYFVCESEPANALRRLPRP